MHWAFAAAKLVGVAFQQGKARAAVLKVYAKLARCRAGAKAPKDRIDQRDRHAVAVHHGDIDGVFMHRFGQRRGRAHRAFRVDQGCEFRGRVG